ncbi:MAG: YbjQ family protein [Lentisphaeria bacterium]|nr:YbjQ family protein [Lentisphaeria bacterium]
MEIEDLVSLIFTIGLPFVLIIGSWIIHRSIENSRHKYLDDQEAYYRNRIRVTNLKLFPEGCCDSATLVSGNAVIASNYFISFISQFKHIFGGEMTGYTQLCTDARRMALVRLLQDAEQVGANMVYNVRFETATVATGNKNKAGGVELIAYGTAVRERFPLAAPIQ